MLGRVLETFPDKNGLVRSARVQTKTNIIVRPVTKLCPFIRIVKDSNAIHLLNENRARIIVVQIY